MDAVSLICKNALETVISLSYSFRKPTCRYQSVIKKQWKTETLCTAGSKESASRPVIGKTIMGNNLILTSELR